MKVTQEQFYQYLSKNYKNPLDYTIKDSNLKSGIVRIRKIIDRATKRVIGFIYHGCYTGKKYFIIDWT